MDEGPLVVEDIDMGARFVERTQAHLSILGAIWVKRCERGKWELFLLSPQVIEGEPFDSFAVRHQVEQELPEPRLDLSRVHLVPANSPFAKEVLQRQRHYPVRLRQGGCYDLKRIRPMDSVVADEAYIYPAASAWPADLPRTRVVGLRDDPASDPPRPVEEEIGFVEGHIGEDDFNRRFAEMVRARFGSVEQFRARYPHILLQSVA